jgi:hypothetical protein
VANLEKRQEEERAEKKERKANKKTYTANMPSPAPKSLFLSDKILSKIRLATHYSGFTYRSDYGGGKFAHIHRTWKPAYRCQSITLETNLHVDQLIQLGGVRVDGDVKFERFFTIQRLQGLHFIHHFET